MIYYMLHRGKKGEKLWFIAFKYYEYFCEDVAKQIAKNKK